MREGFSRHSTCALENNENNESDMMAAPEGSHTTDNIVATIIDSDKARDCQ